MPETRSAIPPAVTVIPIRPGRQIRQAFSARDGHSLGEQAVYDALWANAQPYSETCRIIAAGYRSLSSLCRLTVNNCKANIQSLIAKLAVEEVAAHTYTQSKTYMVFSESAIMKRRAAAGLTHFIKSRGIVFVNAETGLEVGRPETGTPQIVTEPAVTNPEERGIPETGV